MGHALRQLPRTFDSQRKLAFDWWRKRVHVRTSRGLRLIRDVRHGPGHFRIARVRPGLWMGRRGLRCHVSRPVREHTSVGIRDDEHVRPRRGAFTQRPARANHTVSGGCVGSTGGSRTGVGGGSSVGVSGASAGASSPSRRRRGTSGLGGSVGVSGTSRGGARSRMPFELQARGHVDASQAKLER
jgi:hypothetical protein